MATSKEKRKLRKRYLNARSKVSRLMEPYDCGIELARHISADISIAIREFDAVKADVCAAMSRDAAPSEASP